MNNTPKQINRMKLLVLILLLAAVALPFLLQAQGNVSLRWANLSSGYSHSRSAAFSVAATGGEVDGGPTQSGAGLQLTGGFWGGVDEPPPMPPQTTSPLNGLYLPFTIR